MFEQYNQIYRYTKNVMVVDNHNPIRHNDYSSASPMVGVS